MWNFYFRLYPGSIGAEDLIGFLHPHRHIAGKLLTVCDKLPAHRSRAVRDYPGGLHRRIAMHYLLSYAPELNPVEYIWGHCKQYELPNVCAKNFMQLRTGACRALRNMSHRPTLIAAFWKQSSLRPEGL